MVGFAERLGMKRKSAVGTGFSLPVIALIAAAAIFLVIGSLASNIFAQQTVAGLAQGAIFGSLALALVLIYRATEVINFAQGEMAMFTTYIAWALMDHGATWAWWAFVVSGIFGFGSFLAYLGYGYLDTWHGAATLLILPCFVIGLAKSRGHLRTPRGIGSLFLPGAAVNWLSLFGIGRALLLAVAGGMIVGGLTVMTFGMTRVFVPQDLTFMRLARSDLQSISARLIPLIAHDRAGFGGAICTTGATVLICVWCARPSRNLWQILCLAGVIGFATAIGVHPMVGYNDLVHLAPAILGAIMFIVGLILCWKPMRSR